MFLLMEDGDEDVMDFEEYVDKMRGDGEWGGNVELVAASRVYGRGVKIFSGVFDGGVMSIEGGGGGGSDNDGSEEKKNWKNNYNGEKEDGGDLLLSYHENDHYNSVRAINASYPNQSAKEKSDLLSSLNGTAINNTSLKKGKQTQNSNNNTNSNTKGGGRKTMELEVTSQSPGRKKQLTRGADCPCGSGLKYKKCCLSKYKSKTRLDNKMKGKNGVVNDDDNKSGAATAAKANGDDLTTTADNEYIGNFKVLTI